MGQTIAADNRHRWGRLFGMIAVGEPEGEVIAAAILQPANDSQSLFTRLLDYAARGCEEPETLTQAEIKQLSFAVLAFIAHREQD